MQNSQPFATTCSNISTSSTSNTGCNSSLRLQKSRHQPKQATLPTNLWSGVGNGRNSKVTKRLPIFSLPCSNHHTQISQDKDDDDDDNTHDDIPEQKISYDA